MKPSSAVTITSALVLVSLAACGSTSGSVNLESPHSESAAVTLSDIIPTRNFDQAVIVCPYSSRSAVESVTPVRADIAAAVPSDESEQGIVLISDDKVVAADVAARSDVDFCQGVDSGPRTVQQDTPIAGSRQGDTWVVTPQTR